jgi:tetratricopeptide (TPR) repeat protein
MENVERIKELYQSQKYDEILSILGDVKDFDSESFAIKSYYFWSYCKTRYISGDAFSERNISSTREFIKKVIQIFSNNDLIFQFVAMRYIAHEMDKAAPNYSAVNDFLNKLNPDILKEDCFKFKDEKGKDRELASDKEKWYSWKTKCLEEIEDYHNCLKYSQLALENIKKFHYDNDVWFKRRIALSKFELNQREDALKLLDEIIPLKREWFIVADKGFMLIKMGQKEKGTQYLIQALKMAGPDQMKLKIYKYFMDNFNQGKFSDFSKNIRLYTIRIREKNAWSISDENKKILDELSDDLKSKHLSTLKNEIIDFIEAEFESIEISTTGKIERMTIEGKTGYIKPDVGDSIFFRTKNVLNNSKGFSKGTSVTFKVIDSFDKVKNKSSKEAVDVRIIK